MKYNLEMFVKMIHEHNCTLNPILVNEESLSGLEFEFSGFTVEKCWVIEYRGLKSPKDTMIDSLELRFRDNYQEVFKDRSLIENVLPLFEGK